MTIKPRTVAGLALALALVAGPAAATSAHAAPSTSITVSNSVSLKVPDFKTKMTLGFDSGSYALQPAADGQYCDSTDNGSTGNEPMPLGGRQWLWGSSPASNDPQVSVIEIVTIWADGKKALTDLQNDTGACRFGALNLTAFKVVEKSATDFGATWRDGFGSFTAAHSRLVGDVLVSVTVTLPRGTAASTAAEATRLAGIGAERVQRTGLTKNSPVGNEVVPQPVATTEAEKAKVAADAATQQTAAVVPAASSPSSTTPPAQQFAAVATATRTGNSLRPLAV
ncbi:hypothetical protein [Propioniciclava tarda]|uniref:hypothetical protein n=1 Tax=Propioniciclava tarda TaxID=433330 RepID=UPI001172BC61|nr:hypothetical protein [Propioniciclava tarda]SMO63384.1 hypothetical protein SAMN06266982_10965 [Propioniciclava tarda]